VLVDQGGVQEKARRNAGAGEAGCCSGAAENVDDGDSGAVDDAL